MLEARQLRELGYTQQMIADTLGVPLRTIEKWTINMGSGKASNLGNVSTNTQMINSKSTHIAHPITLYPCKLEV